MISVLTSLSQCCLEIHQRLVLVSSPSNRPLSLSRGSTCWAGSRLLGSWAHSNFVTKTAPTLSHSRYKSVDISQSIRMSLGRGLPLMTQFGLQHHPRVRQNILLNHTLINLWGRGEDLFPVVWSDVEGGAELG